VTPSGPRLCCVLVGGEPSATGFGNTAEASVDETGVPLLVAPLVVKLAELGLDEAGIV
jgi:hypothetical protein